jgi:hypothetical protein
MPQVERICTQLLLMKTGEVVHKSKDVHDGINKYYAMFYRNPAEFTAAGPAKLKEIKLGSGSRLAASNDNKAFAIDYGEALDLYLHLEVNTGLPDVRVNITFFDQSQSLFGAVYSANSGLTIDCKNGSVFLKVSVPTITFAQGIYSLTIVCRESHTGQVLFRRQSAAYFQVVGKIHGWAPVIFPASWQQSDSFPEEQIIPK